MSKSLLLLGLTARLGKFSGSKGVVELQVKTSTVLFTELF